MSSKQRPGLPSDFRLEVTAEEPVGPVHVEDYLDRELPPVRATPPPTTASTLKETVPRADPLPAKTRPAAARVLEAWKSAPQSELAREKARPTELSGKAAPRKKAPRRPPRMELSLDAETERKAQEVVADIREQGPQDDATASEFVRGLVQLAHDVRHKANYSHLNRRGQWGSATARAFVADLKEAFLRAIGQLYIDRYPREARQQLFELNPDNPELHDEE